MASNDIAVVGAAFKLPQGVEDESKLWDVLSSGQNPMTNWPESRVNIGSFYDDDPTKINKLHSKGAHLLDTDPGAFDAPFFSIPARKAAAMDPQQRLPVGGIPISKIKGSKTAVFSASFSDDYARVVGKDPDNFPQTVVTGTALSILANRVSWYFDLRGPSVHLDTACSSSLVAVDLACQCLAFEFEFLSPDSLCYSFDHRANGYARGEGVVAIVLKPVLQAVQDGDIIRAIIRSTGSNQDGKTAVITQPSPEAQETLIRSVYDKADLDYSLTRYFEAHVGDPIEMKTIGSVFRSSRSSSEPLFFGSVKANLGHLEGYSGLAGIVKSLMVLEKGIIPPNALFDKINPEMDTEYWGTNAQLVMDDAWHYLQTRSLVALSRNTLPLGAGDDPTRDSNGSVLRKGAEDQVANTLLGARAARQPEVLLAWSAPDEKSLEGVGQSYNEYDLEAMAFTLATRRSQFLWRTFSVVDREHSPQLTGFPMAKAGRASSRAAIAFVFTGQGAQYVQMGMGLIQHPIFHETMRKMDLIYLSLGCSWSIFGELRKVDTIHRPDVSQPLCTALQVSLVDLLGSLGVVPKVVVGHSSGEISAAYTIGALSLESVCKVSYCRGQVAEKVRGASASCPGAMMSVNIAHDQSNGYLDIEGYSGMTNIQVACINSPLNTTLSGKEDAIDSLKERLDRDGVFAQKLKKGVAYHSSAMQSIADEYASLMGSLDTGRSSAHPTIPMVSSVSGSALNPETLTKTQYWIDNMVMPVRFLDAVQNVLQVVPTISDFVEVGAHSALRRPVQDILSGFANKEGADISPGQIKICIALYPGGNQQDPGDRPLPILLDGPAYSFDHSRVYWAESRFSTDYRLRKPASSDILGLPVSDWNPLWPKWRSCASIETAPRLRDHEWLTGELQVSGTILFPGMGMLVMALEAIKQSCPSMRLITGYQVKEANFLAPAIIPDTPSEHTEMVTESRKQWSECFRGKIRVQYEDFTESMYHGIETFLAHAEILGDYEDATRTCKKQINRQTFYKHCADQGIKYGDFFTLLDSICWDGKKLAIARVDISDGKHGSTNLVHPAILDSAVQSLYRMAALSDFDVDDSGSILCEMKRFILKPIGNNGIEQPINTQRLLYGINWKPQLSLLDATQLRHLCHAESFEKDDTAMELYRQKLDVALDQVIHRTIRLLTDKDQGQDSDDLEPILEELERLYPPFQIFPVVVRNLRPILLGETNPLSLVFDTGLAERLYADIFDNISDHRFTALLQLLVHEKPNLKILEVGASTSGWTKRVLSTFDAFERETGANTFSEYVYSDISDAFFLKASQQFQEFEGRLRFKTLDLEQPAACQGFQLGSYDLVIAGSVLHATSDLTATIRNVRSLLKPGGKLLNIEITSPQKLETNFAFGLLPGWWLSCESYRSLCPGIGESHWDRLLRDNHFSGNDLVLRDHETNICHAFSLMVSTAQNSILPSDLTNGAPNTNVLLLIDARSSRQVDLARIIEPNLSAPSGYAVKVLQMDSSDLSDLAASHTVVSLLEIDRPLLSEMVDSEFESLKAITRQLHKLLWVTSCSVQDEQYAHYAFMQGLFRSLRSEAAEKQIVTLAIESLEPDLPTATCADYILKVFDASSHAETPELEYIVRDGMIRTGRLERDAIVSENVRSLALPKMMTEPSSDGPALKLAIATPGLLNTLRLIEDTYHQAELGPEEIEIEAKAWGLSFKDIFVALGRLEGDELGIDCSGVVTRVGSECHGIIAPGDRVPMCSLGCMRTYPRAPACTVVKIPDSISFEAATSIINAGIMAYYCLIEKARLGKGETILIHAAAGSTGQMAWALEAKRQLMMEQFDIPEDHIFYSRNLSFADGVKRMTNNRGVDVVLNSLSGDGLIASWECVTPFGRFVEIGKADITSNSPLPMTGFARNISFHAADLWHVAQSSSELCGELFRGIMNLITQGLIQPPAPLCLYPVAEVEKALRFVQSGKNTGRTIITIDPSEKVQKGARNLIVLSRSGPSSEMATEIMTELSKHGVNIAAPKYDVSSIKSLSDALSKYGVDSLMAVELRNWIGTDFKAQVAVFDIMGGGTVIFDIGDLVLSRSQLVGVKAE
ncbi:Uu.00g034960.m01.CDS01 [Anthostomella pinea]|uniref:Uu.00g034960.m01.CDS01 n=1 Tax=Anthostomella pinea TaxID=933095 RepID=A0AAI8YDJ6_9PEZI|nr:Uu.00g034960.m01.CDS01 [Anthostomella pinea]